MICKQSLLLAVIASACFAVNTGAQVDDICGEFGYIATLEGPRLSAPFIYGRITVKGQDASAKFPNVTVTYQNRSQSPERITISKSGNYCFRITSGAGGTLMVEIDGVEVARRQVATLAPAQQREDFEVFVDRSQSPAAPGVVSTKFYRPPNKKTVDLYKKAAESEEKKDIAGAIKHLTEIVAIDPEDFIAWGLMANLHLERKAFDEAEAALRRALELKIEYTPAWVTAGRVRLARKQYEATIEVLKHAVSLEPEAARIYQLLGEAYLFAKQGTLGAEALNKALQIDPVGMAECHLQLAHLYQLAGAKQMAAKEYKTFLEKVPEHPDKKRLEKFIKENP